MVFVPWHPCTSATVNAPARGFEPHQTPRTACNSPCSSDENLVQIFVYVSEIKPGNTWYAQERRCAYGAHAALCLPQLLARAKVSVCTTVSLAPSADAHDHRALLCPAPCRARAWRQPRSARATQSCIRRPRQATSLGSQSSGRTPATDIARLIARYPPASLSIRRLHPETSRHRTRELRDHAATSARRITTRRRLAGGVRQTGAQRPSVRGSISASIQGAISARVSPSSARRHARSTR